MKKNSTKLWADFFELIAFVSLFAIPSFLVAWIWEFKDANKYFFSSIVIFLFSFVMFAAVRAPDKEVK